ncbi:hypothetical protein ACOME3_004064 [Neoechinorhynchus agilis]
MTCASVAPTFVFEKHARCAFSSSVTMNTVLFSILITVALVQHSYPTELTFNLPAGKKQCFYEESKRIEVDVALQFQVVAGGHDDVNVELYSPSGQLLFSVKHEDYGQYFNSTTETGIYKLCISNEFSTMTSRLVYFNFEIDEESEEDERISGNGVGRHAGPLTLFAAKLKGIHANLDKIQEALTLKRLLRPGLKSNF